MKRREFLRHLADHGCALDREGENYSIYRNPANGRCAAVPRHREIKNTLARTSVINSASRDLRQPAKDDSLQKVSFVRFLARDDGTTRNVTTCEFVTRFVNEEGSRPLADCRRKETVPDTFSRPRAKPPMASILRPSPVSPFLPTHRSLKTENRV